jgi:hypothetical protein
MSSNVKYLISINRKAIPRAMVLAPRTKTERRPLKAPEGTQRNPPQNAQLAFLTRVKWMVITESFPFWRQVHDSVM